MASRKQKQKKRSRQHLSNVAESESRRAAPIVAGRTQSAFSTAYLSTIWRLHPIRPNALLIYFAVVSVVAFLLALAAMKGLLSQFFLQIAGENMAPRTAIVLGALSLLVLSAVIAFRGPFTSRTSRLYKTFGVTLPSIALVTWGTLCGISVGVLGAAGVLGAPTEPYLGEVGSRLLVFFFGLAAFLTITVTTDDAPAYRTDWFKSGIRQLAWIFFLVLLGWFIVGALYVGA